MVGFTECKQRSKCKAYAHILENFLSGLTWTLATKLCAEYQQMSDRTEENQQRQISILEKKTDHCGTTKPASGQTVPVNID